MLQDSLLEIAILARDATKIPQFESTETAAHTLPSYNGGEISRCFFPESGPTQQFCSKRDRAQMIVICFHAPWVSEENSLAPSSSRMAMNMSSSQSRIL